MSEVKVVMPKLGMLMEEGTVVKWLKNEGDNVKKDEVVALIESQKLTGEVKAPADGVLYKILVKEGETAKVGEAIGIIKTS